MVTQWHFKMANTGTVVEWDWQEHGEPAIDALLPIRQPKSSNRQRHIPAMAFSVTNRGYVQLESGLELDLLRRLDRDPQIVRIVPQPCRLTWDGDLPGEHTPDILTLQGDGSVTLWDVRPKEEQDEDFHRAAAASRQACGMVGWQYEVFDGLGDTEKLNLLWLTGFRHQQVWYERFERQVRLAAHPETTLGALFDLDDGTGELISTVWHLIWLGTLKVDLAELLEPWALVECRHADT